jgi:deoxycytidylate deaminase
MLYSNSLNKRDQRFAILALKEANKSNMRHHQHGCIAVLGGQIIARGYNSDRTQSSDGFLKNTCSCHAEIDVMRKLEKRLNKKTSRCWLKEEGRVSFYGKISLYVVRKNSNDNGYKDSAPCKRCGDFMKSLQIKNVIWSDGNGNLVKCKVKDYETNHISQGNRFFDRNNYFCKI